MACPLPETSAPACGCSPEPAPLRPWGRLKAAFGLVVAGVLLVGLLGERLGILGRLEEAVPFPIGAALVGAAGFPVFREVLGAARRGRVTPHTLMTLGTLAALGAGQWTSALVVVFFMRVGEAIERFTAEQAGQGIKVLLRQAPQRAVVLRNGQEVEVPASDLQVGEMVIVRNGGRIPADGVVVAGRAAVDQSALTGEAMPAEVGPGDPVYAATTIRQGSIRVRVDRVGPDTTFGQVIRLVAEAETHRGPMQRWADRFSAYFLPVVLGLAAVVLVAAGPLTAAAVLVVACSCAFGLATPVAVLAAVGAAARHGILIKGGRFIEALARADVLLIDKTGTVTFGRPRVAEILPLNGWSEAEVLGLAAAAEAGSDHPIAVALRSAARERGLEPRPAEDVREVPGMGVQAAVDGRRILVGRPESLGVSGPVPAGKTAVGVALEGPDDIRRPCGLITLIDAPRPEVPEALRAIRSLGIGQVELLTGDRPGAAARLAADLGIPYRAGLMPEEKLKVVRDFQARGHTVVMVGDGINDAPALAAADVGVAMGAVGSDVAVATAPVVLLGEDWRLIPATLALARRTLRVIRLNLLFTAGYNLVGLGLAAVGLLPVPAAAAAQAIPDLLILGNSARLLGWRPPRRP